MQTEYQDILSELLRDYLLKYQEDLDLSDSQVAKIIGVTDEAYYDLLRGSLPCNNLALAGFLIYFCNNPSEFLTELRCAFDACAECNSNRQIQIADLLEKVISYRRPMKVRSVRYYKSIPELYSFPLCPRCERPMNREYQAFCEHCGQALDWKQFSKAIVTVV